MGIRNTLAVSLAISSPIRPAWDIQKWALFFLVSYRFANSTCKTTFFLQITDNLQIFNSIFVHGIQKGLSIFVELNMQNFPVTDADAGVTALMTLVAIVTTKEKHLSLMVDSDFINRKKTKAGAREF